MATVFCSGLPKHDTDPFQCPGARVFAFSRVFASWSLPSHHPRAPPPRRGGLGASAKSSKSAVAFCAAVPGETSAGGAGAEALFGRLFGRNAGRTVVRTGGNHWGNLMNLGWFWNGARPFCSFWVNPGSHGTLTHSPPLCSMDFTDLTTIRSSTYALLITSPSAKVENVAAFDDSNMS